MACTKKDMVLLLPCTAAFLLITGSLVQASTAFEQFNVLTINKTLLQDRVNATITAALSSQPSLNQAVAAASGAFGSVHSARNASKNLARSYWFLNRTIAYNPTNQTQLGALAEYTYRRLQFESLLKQGYAFTTTSAVPSSGQGVEDAASNITCFVDPRTGVVTNLQQSSKLACSTGGQRFVVPTAGKYLTKLEMAIDKELPLIGRFVFHVRDTLDSKPKVFTCGFAGGDAISLFPPGYIATSVDVGCIPLTPQAIGKKRRSLSKAPINAANPELVKAVVLSESVANEKSPDKPVSALVVATGVVQGSTFAISASSLSPTVVTELEYTNKNGTNACPSSTPDICSAVGGGSVCVNFAGDNANCGSCNNVCPSAQTCASGTCSCPSSKPNFCSAVGCVDFLADNANCGSCNNVCPSAQTCVSGTCSCPSSKPNFCSAVGCVDFLTDDANCGSCNNVCGIGTSCQFGQCRCSTISVVIDVLQTTSSKIVATVACAGAPPSELSFKCVAQGGPKESPGLGSVSFDGVTAVVSGLTSCFAYDCYAVRSSPGGNVYSPPASAVTITNIAFTTANGFTTTNQPPPISCVISRPYLPGSILGQGPGTDATNKWSLIGGRAFEPPNNNCNQGKPFDEQITSVSGEQVWRLSNAVVTTGFGNCPYMQRVLAAGEPGSNTNGAGSVPNGANRPQQTTRLCSAFTFRSSTGASQAGLSVEASTAPAYSSFKQNFLSIQNGATGFELYTSARYKFLNGTVTSTNPVKIAGVNFTDWHRVVTTVDFVDGINQGPCPAELGSAQCFLGNDIVKIFVDGNLAWQGSSWEAGYYPSKQAVDSFFICPRVPVNTPSNPGTLGNGFLFKNYGIGN